MAEGLPSLDLVASRVEAQLEHQLRHFDGRMEEGASALLDRKAFRLRLAVGLLALAVFLVAASMLFTGGSS